MILINKIDFISIEDIKSNSDKYKNIYLKDKIIVFKNANLNKDQQTELMIFFGDLLGWFPNSIDSSPSDYIEDHHKHMVGNKYASKDQLMLNWHTEHAQNEDDPHYGATWRMEKFECPEDSGHTYFVDMTKMFQELKTEDQDFLSRCTTILDAIEFKYDTGEKKEVRTIKEFSVIQNHPITNEKTIRLLLFAYDSKLNNLSKIDGRVPNQEEKNRYRELISWICKEVWTNTDIRMVLKWNEGDFAVPDLYKLAHAVSGGFVENQRTLSGQFGKAKPWKRRVNDGKV